MNMTKPLAGIGAILRLLPVLVLAGTAILASACTPAPTVTTTTEQSTVRQIVPATAPTTTTTITRTQQSPP